MSHQFPHGQVSHPLSLAFHPAHYPPVKMATFSFQTVPGSASPWDVSSLLPPLACLTSPSCAKSCISAHCPYTTSAVPAARPFCPQSHSTAWDGSPFLEGLCMKSSSHLLSFQAQLLTCTRCNVACTRRPLCWLWVGTKQVCMEC